MKNDFPAHVNTAKQICTAFSQLLRIGRPSESQRVRLVFAGFDAIEAVASLGTQKGAIHIIPEFDISDGVVFLKKVWVADGMTCGDMIVHTTCDPILFRDGSVGLLTDFIGSNFEYRCVAETYFTRRVLPRPRNAAKLVERGRRAIAEESRRLFAMAD